MKNTRIKCKTIEEAKKVLQMIEDRHPEVRWGEGEKPTEFYPWNRVDCMKGCWLSVTGNYLAYTTPDTLYPYLWVNATSAKRFLRRANTSIHIYQRGKTVIAHESETGREGIAKCSPDDKFDFSIGARIALLRLFGEEVPDSLTGKDKAEFKVGDRVVIRDWDDMEKEFGLNCNGNIECNKTFSQGMRKFCGRVAKITRFNSFDNSVIGLEFEDGTDTGLYTFSTDMIKKVGENHKPTKFQVGDLVTLKDGVDRYDSPGGIRIHDEMFEMGHCKPMEVEAVDDTIVGTMYTCKSEHDPYHFTFHDAALDKWEDIKVGDTVEIVNSGKCYANYSEWVARNVEDKETIAKYAYGFTPRVGTRGKVLQIADHLRRSDGLLVYINDGTTDKCYLIGINGVKKVES
jgi:hypothetical protein